MPPPVIAGVEIANRRINSETTLTGRTLVYPFPFLIFGLDIGKNWLEGKSFYRGLAAGTLFSFEESADLAINVGMRMGLLAERGGGRGELRADGVLVQGEIGILLSATIGVSRGRLQ